MVLCYSRRREVISVTDRILKIKFSIVLVWSLFILTLSSKHVKLDHSLAAVVAGFMCWLGLCSSQQFFSHGALLNLQH